MTTLIISKTVDGIETVLGTIQFTDSGEPKLSTNGSAPEHKQLEAVWQEIVTQAELPLSVTERKEVDGEIVSEFNTRLVAKDDEEYPHAVWSFLERRRSYLVDLQQ